MMVIQFSDIWTHVPWTANHSDSAFSRWAWVSWSTIGFPSTSSERKPSWISGTVFSLVGYPSCYPTSSVIALTETQSTDPNQSGLALPYPVLSTTGLLMDGELLSSYHFSDASTTLVMAALWNRAGHYIFALLFPSFFFYLFSSPNLTGQRLDVYHTSTHGVALVRI